MKDNRLNPAKDDRAFYVNALASEECICGKYKQAGFAFCFGCFKTLPKEHRRGLYKKAGAGFEEAYDECALYLSRNLNG